MDAGKYNNRIKIQKRTVTKIKGIPTDVWEDYYSCWCSINSLFGNELYKALEIQLQNILNFTVRYAKVLENLNTKDFRVVWNNRTFNIVNPDYLGFSKKEIIIKAQEVL